MAAFVSRDLSNESRDALVEQLKTGEVVTTAPKMLELMREYACPSEPGIGAKPWMNNAHSHRAKVWYAACAVWEGLFSGMSNPAKASILVELLEGHSDAYSRYVILNELLRHWNTAAREPVWKLFEDTKSPVDTKIRCANVLMTHLPKEHASAVIDLMEQPELSLQCRESLFRTFGSAALAKIGRDEKVRLVRAGFRLLIDQKHDQPKNSHAGYLVACGLGEVVGSKFKPDQNDPQYRSRRGLTDAFFSDTVKAGLEWWQENKQRFAAEKE